MKKKIISVAIVIALLASAQTGFAYNEPTNNEDITNKIELQAQAIENERTRMIYWRSLYLPMK